MQFPFPALVCDVGGTNIRVGAIGSRDGRLHMLARLSTHDHGSLVAALASVIATMSEHPRSLMVCAAGPVRGRALTMTNMPWALDGPEIADALDLEQGLLLNDFEAQALSLPALAENSREVIGPALPPGTGPHVILGPGTGLGVGALVESQGRFLPLASEAAHIALGPVSEDEAAIWPHLERVHGRTTAEAVLSGHGLVRLHHARLAVEGARSGVRDEIALVADATANRASAEADTVRLFWQIVARFAGDIAITFAATGGVTLAGGILPRIRTFLDASAFRTAFEAKAPVDALARAIPTALIVDPNTVLPGMAAIVSAPERYAIDYAARLWR